MNSLRSGLVFSKNRRNVRNMIHSCIARSRDCGKNLSPNRQVRLCWCASGLVRFRVSYATPPSESTKTCCLVFSCECLRTIKWFPTAENVKRAFSLSPQQTVSVRSFGQFHFVGRNGKMLVTIRGHLTLINQSILPKI